MLWRGGDTRPTLCDFDVVDGRVTSTEGLADLNVDLAGAFTMPAFRDGHCHPLFAGREHVGPDVTEAKSLAEIQSLISSYASLNPEVIWIDAAAYDPSIAANFHRSELDSAVLDQPVVLHSSDHHTLWVNTKALELSGLLHKIPALSAGSIDIDEQGIPTGIIREWEAMQFVMSKLPALTIEQELDCLDWAQAELLRYGIAEVQDAWIDPGMAEIYLESARRGRLKVRINLAFRADPASWLEDFDYFDMMRAEVTAQNNSNLHVYAIKFFVDGVLGSSTASLLEPYVAGPKVHTHGEQVWPKVALLAAAAEATARGYQLHLHAIGDAAVRTALDVIETVSPKIAAVIAHAELISDVDLPRFAELNITANLQPLWAREDGQLMSCVPQVDRVRIDKLYRMRDLLSSAARLAFGSDWPVSSPNALTGVATAVNRCLPGGSSWTIGQAVTVKEALNAYTNGVAAQLSNSERPGTLFPGDRAEFITLSQNPFEVLPARLFEIQITQIYL